MSEDIPTSPTSIEDAGSTETDTGGSIYEDEEGDSQFIRARIVGVHPEIDTERNSGDSPLLKDFTALALSQPILRALADEGYVIPTPIQAKAIPPALEGKDLLGCAQTGTGKTAAFALPILHLLSAKTADPARRGPLLPRALILSPTRELAVQIGVSFATYGRHTGLTNTVIYGGVSQKRCHAIYYLMEGNL
jgi:superfamily II DNA/RNA helicase